MFFEPSIGTCPLALFANVSSDIAYKPLRWKVIVSELVLLHNGNDSHHISYISASRARLMILCLAIVYKEVVYFVISIKLKIPNPLIFRRVFCFLE